MELAHGRNFARGGWSHSDGHLHLGRSDREAVRRTPDAAYRPGVCGFGVCPVWLAVGSGFSDRDSDQRSLVARRTHLAVADDTARIPLRAGRITRGARLVARGCHADWAGIIFADLRLFHFSGTRRAGRALVSGFDTADDFADRKSVV